MAAPRAVSANASGLAAAINETAAAIEEPPPIESVNQQQEWRHQPKSDGRDDEIAASSKASATIRSALSSSTKQPSHPRVSR